MACDGHVTPDVCFKIDNIRIDKCRVPARHCMRHVTFQFQLRISISSSILFFIVDVAVAVADFAAVLQCVYVCLHVSSHTGDFFAKAGYF